MQSRDALAAIAEEIPIECTIIERSRLSQEVFKARVTKLSMKRAVARFQADIPVLSDLEIRIDIQDGQRVPGALYGKVTEVVHDSGFEFLIYFTSMSEEIKMALSQLLETPGKLRPIRRATLGTQPS
jgi:hypothetical protein